MDQGYRHALLRHHEAAMLAGVSQHQADLLNDLAALTQRAITEARGLVECNHDSYRVVEAIMDEVGGVEVTLAHSQIAVVIREWALLIGLTTGRSRRRRVGVHLSAWLMADNNLDPRQHTGQQAFDYLLSWFGDGRFSLVGSYVLNEATGPEQAAFCDEWEASFKEDTTNEPTSQ